MAANNEENVARELIFSPLAANEQNQQNSTVRSRARQKQLAVLLQTFKEGDDVNSWFREFMSRAGTSYLNNNQGCIIEVLYAKVPVNTEFGKHLRESIVAAWERARVTNNESIDINDEPSAVALLTYIVEQVQLTYPRDLYDTPNEWLTKAHNFKFEPNESIQGYYNRCREITMKLAQHQQALTAVQIDTMFKEGLPADLKGPIKEKNIVGLPNLLKATLTYVRNYNMEGKYPLNDKGKSSAKVNSVAVDTSKDSDAKGPDATPKEEESTGMTGLYDNPIPRAWLKKPCCKCANSSDEKKKKSAEKHSFAFCWDNPKGLAEQEGYGGKRKMGERGNGNGSSKKKGKDLSKIKCYNCQDYGHYASNCPQPKRKKKQGNGLSSTAQNVSTTGGTAPTVAQIDALVAARINAITEAARQKAAKEAAETERLTKAMDTWAKGHNLL